MGGKGSGGKRPGTGSKPRTFRSIDGGMGLASGAGAQGVTEPFEVPAPPDSLADDAKAIWLRDAPLAVRRQTLTKSTAYAFEILCSAIVLERLLANDPEKAGGSDHRGMLQRVETGLLRFDLAPNGKPHGDVQATKRKSALEELKDRRKALQVVG